MQKFTHYMRRIFCKKKINQTRSQKDTKGFTLIELSIVLVIIGLVVGGVLAGQDLIKAAELRKLQSDFVAIETKMYTFYDRFGYWPGDFPKATTVLASDIRDGNGDRQINSSPGNLREDCKFWDHLSRSGIHKSTLSCDPVVGGTNAGGYWPDLALSLPQSIGNTYIQASNRDITRGGSLVITNNKSYLMASNGTGNLTGGFIPEGFLKSEETYLYDLKFDDGVATTGRIRGTSIIGPGYDCQGSGGDYINPSTPDENTCVVFYTLN